MIFPRSVKQTRMNKSLAVIFSFCLLLNACVSTKYVEKQSPELSASVYAVQDSIWNGRFDLAEFYSAETTRLVVPPDSTKRIKIKPLILTE